MAPPAVEFTFASSLLAVAKLPLAVAKQPLAVGKHNTLNNLYRNTSTKSCARLEEYCGLVV